MVNILRFKPVFAQGGGIMRRDVLERDKTSETTGNVSLDMVMENIEPKSSTTITISE